MRQTKIQELIRAAHSAGDDVLDRHTTSRLRVEAQWSIADQALPDPLALDTPEGCIAARNGSNQIDS